MFKETLCAHSTIATFLTNCETTMERTLKQFLDSGLIRKIGAGRGAAYSKS